MKQFSCAKITLVLAFSGLLATLFGMWMVHAGNVEAQGDTNLVLAFYYAWYNPDSFGPGKTPFQPVDAYRSGDPSTIQRHVSQAQGAAIDGFVQSWYGPHETITDGNFSALLDVAAANGFKAAIDFEPATFLHSHEARANALKSLIETHAAHPAYLRLDGKPVIFFWANWAYSVDDWAAIRSAADPDHNTIWIAEGGNTEYLAVFDGLHLYNTAWAPNPAGIASTWAAETRAAAQTYGAYKYWIATAMPGFDDRHLGRGEESVYRSRAGGAYYQNSFSAAAASNPDMLVITSFNEWAEGSNIEPSVEFGNLYLDLTAQLAGSYKSGGVAPPPPLPEATDAPASAVDAENVAAQDETPAPTGTGPASPPSQPSPTAQPDGSIVYEVAEGDTLSAISARFQVPLESLYAYNDLDEDSLLRVGQSIVIGFSDESQAQAGTSPAIPPGAELRDDGTLVHVVEQGDTLISVAVQYDLTMDEILALNAELTEESLLQVGQDIVIGQRQEPADVGGSTDFPESTASAPPSPSPDVPETSTPSPVPTVTATTQVAEAESSEPADGAPDDSPAPTSQAADGSEPASRAFNAGPTWLPFIAGFIVLLAVTGSVFFYLGWRRSDRE